MSKLLLRLNKVPDDEANEIRSILSEKNIAYYETYAGTFGIGVAGIWLREESAYEEAKSLLDEYAKNRLLQARENYQHAVDNNENDTFIKKCLREPLKVFLCVLAVGFILYISVVPFLNIAIL